MIKFPFGTNGKSIILGVPILKHIIVVLCPPDDSRGLLRFVPILSVCLSIHLSVYLLDFTI